MSLVNKTSAAQVAVLMTCHNRRETTLKCLAVLQQQAVDFALYLVDDGSHDCTAEAVRDRYPAANILTGDGSLFWVGGMRLAYQAAAEREYPYYLWLNDDTLLDPEALQTLLTTHQSLAEKEQTKAIIVGSVQDPKTGALTYGGRTRPTRWYSFKFEPVPPAAMPQPCDTFQGNAVLIPNSVAQKVGNIDAAFVHNFGDLDYGLRARKIGCSIWTAPGFVATCAQNSAADSWVDTTLSVRSRLKKALQVKAFPLQAWTTYLRRHAGPAWFIYWPLPYLRAVIGYRNLANSPTFAEKQPTPLP